MTALLLIAYIFFADNYESILFENPYITIEMSADWNLYKHKHKLSLNFQQDVKRFQIFVNNSILINNFNQNNQHMQLKMNKFGHLTNNEYREIYLMTPIKVDAPQVKLTANRKFSWIDWRDWKVVNRIRNQESCGSCWAFSSTGSMEGAYALRTGKLVEFSKQDLVDCGFSEGAQGCSGGFMTQAFSYTMKYGIPLESEYPYRNREMKCHHYKMKNLTKISNFIEIPMGNEDQLTFATVEFGPISIAVDASGDAFKFYHSGIHYNQTCENFLVNHAILLVGVYEDYYLIKNSWGTEWGEMGYAKMVRNRGNNCGIASMASFPLV